jgi:hypothetical protein
MRNCVLGNSLQEFAELIAMTGINGHNNIVQERERESIPEQPLDKREIKADAHAVLMTLAVKSGRREKSLIESFHTAGQARSCGVQYQPVTESI